MQSVLSPFVGRLSDVLDRKSVLPCVRAGEDFLANVVTSSA